MFTNILNFFAGSNSNTPAKEKILNHLSKKHDINNSELESASTSKHQINISVEDFNEYKAKIIHDLCLAKPAFTWSVKGHPVIAEITKEHEAYIVEKASTFVLGELEKKFCSTAFDVVLNSYTYSDGKSLAFAHVTGDIPTGYADWLVKYDDGFDTQKYYGYLGDNEDANYSGNIYEVGADELAPIGQKVIGLFDYE